MNGGLFILLGALIEQECQERVQKMIKEEIQIHQAKKVNLATSEDITDPTQTSSSCQNNTVVPEVIVHSKCWLFGPKPDNLPTPHWKEKKIPEIKNRSFSYTSVFCKATLSTLFENHPKCLIWIFKFWHFYWNFWHSKCKRSSLRSQCWMGLFLWFSNTVLTVWCITQVFRK